MDEPFASLDAIVRARVIQDVVKLVERERISVLLVTHDLEEALWLSDAVYLMSQGPRARILEKYIVPMPRPLELIRSPKHPAFAPLYERLWRDLSREVGEAPRLAAAKMEAAWWPLLRTMYLATLVCPISMPSLSSSPWIRGAPHSGLARLIHGSNGGSQPAPSVFPSEASTSSANRL